MSGLLLNGWGEKAISLYQSQTYQVLIKSIFESVNSATTYKILQQNNPCIYDTIRE